MQCTTGDLDMYLDAVIHSLLDCSEPEVPEPMNRKFQNAQQVPSGKKLQILSHKNFLGALIKKNYAISMYAIKYFLVNFNVGKTEIFGTVKCEPQNLCSYSNGNVYSLQDTTFFLQ